MSIEILRVPLLNANEDELIVVGIHVDDGAQVAAGTLLFSLESTKASTDIEAPRAGFVRAIGVKEEQRVAVGATLCLLTDEADEPLPDAVTRVEDDDVRATKRARELAVAHGVELGALGVDGIIQERHVRAVISGAAAAEPLAPLGPPRAFELVGGGRDLVILGAGGHARVLIDLIREGRRDLHLVGVVDDGASPPDEVLGVPVLGSSARLPELRERGVRWAALGVGAVTHNATRIHLFEKLTAFGFELPCLVHPRAAVEPSVRFLGPGVQVFASATVGSNVELGANAIINSGVVVSHDCRIGAHAHLTPGAILAGAVTVGENTVVGMGVTAYLGLTIGRDVVVSNGVHLMRDVPDGTLVKTS